MNCDVVCLALCRGFECCVARGAGGAVALVGSVGALAVGAGGYGRGHGRLGCIGGCAGGAFEFHGCVAAFVSLGWCVVVVYPNGSVVGRWSPFFSVFAVGALNRALVSGAVVAGCPDRVIRC